LCMKIWQDERRQECPFHHLLLTTFRRRKSCFISQSSPIRVRLREFWIFNYLTFLSQFAKVQESHRCQWRTLHRRWYSNFSQMLHPGVPCVARTLDWRAAIACMRLTLAWFALHPSIDWWSTLGLAWLENMQWIGTRLSDQSKNGITEIAIVSTRLFLLGKQKHFLWTGLDRLSRLDCAKMPDRCR
jgi:hypothetical protein